MSLFVSSSRFAMHGCVLLLLLSSNRCVDGRCAGSPTLERLLETEDYVIRAWIEKNYDNSDGKVCNSRQAKPVQATVTEVFKGTNAGKGIFPAVNDTVLLNYMTDTGYMPFGFYVDADLNWDSEGYLLFPALQTGCVDTHDTFPVYSLNSCYYEGTKGWSSLDDDVKAILRSTDEWRNNTEQPPPTQPLLPPEELGTASTSNARIDGTTATTTTTTTNGEEDSSDNDVIVATTITDDADDTATTTTTTVTTVTTGEDELEEGVVLPANANANSDIISSSSTITTTTGTTILLVLCIVFFWGGA